MPFSVVEQRLLKLLKLLPLCMLKKWKLINWEQALLGDH